MHQIESLQSSPKHKPVSREDSPIRSKEPFYGGAHHHNIISSTNQKLEEEEAAADGRLHKRAVLTATLISTSQSIPGSALVCTLLRPPSLLTILFQVHVLMGSMNNVFLGERFFSGAHTTTALTFHIISRGYSKVWHTYSW